MPEEITDKSTEAYKAGYRTIADITRARIDKVIAKLKEEYPDTTQDLSCAHLTLAPSNFKVWRGQAVDEATLREQLNIFQSTEETDHVKGVDPHTAMLTELLLKLGLGVLGVHAISKPRTMAGVTVHRVLLPDDQYLWVCFEPYNSQLKDEIVKNKPAKVVMLNSCFKASHEHNADELMANLQLELADLGIDLTII